MEGFDGVLEHVVVDGPVDGEHDEEAGEDEAEADEVEEDQLIPHFVPLDEGLVGLFGAEDLLEVDSSQGVYLDLAALGLYAVLGGFSFLLLVDYLDPVVEEPHRGYAERIVSLELCLFVFL